MSLVLCSTLWIHLNLVIILTKLGHYSHFRGDGMKTQRDCDAQISKRQSQDVNPDPPLLATIQHSLSVFTCKREWFIVLLTIRCDRQKASGTEWTLSEWRLQLFRPQVPTSFITSWCRMRNNAISFFGQFSCSVNLKRVSEVNVLFIGLWNSLPFFWVCV